MSISQCACMILAVNERSIFALPYIDLDFERVFAIGSVVVHIIKISTSLYIRDRQTEYLPYEMSILQHAPWFNRH